MASNSQAQDGELNKKEFSKAKSAAWGSKKSHRHAFLPALKGGEKS